MAKWQVGPPTKKGRYHIAWFRKDDGPVEVTEVTYDGKSDYVNGFDHEEGWVIGWKLGDNHIKAHKPYPTITKHWIEHLEEYKKPGVRK